MNTQIRKGLEWVKAATEEGFIYVKWDGTKPAKECPICCNHIRGGDHWGGNCIWFASAYLRHGMGMKDVKCACNGLLGGSSAYTMLLVLPRRLAQAFVDSRLGHGRFRLIRNDHCKNLEVSDLQPGDIIIYYKNRLFWHVAVYIGDGKIIDCASKPGGVTERSWTLPYSCKVALRL